MFSFVFFKLRLSLLLNMQNNEKNYEGAESEKAKKNKQTNKQTKKSYSIAKNNFVRSHSFMTSAKKVEISDQHPPLPLYPQTSYFGLSTPHHWTSLTGIQNPPIHGNFEFFLENFNNEINTVTYSFFLCYCTKYLLFSYV